MSLTALVLICSAAVADCTYGNADNVRQPPPPTIEYEGHTYSLPTGIPFTVYKFAEEWAAEQVGKGGIVLRPGQRIEIRVYKASDNPGEHKA